MWNIMKNVGFLLALLLACNVASAAETLRYRHISHTTSSGVTVSPLQGGVGSDCIYIFDDDRHVIQRLSGGDVLWEYSHSAKGEDVYFPADEAGDYRKITQILYFSKNHKRVKWVKIGRDGRRSLTIGEKF